MIRALLFATALVLPITVSAQTTSAAGSTVEGAARSITPSDVRHRIGVIAHDSMLGRDTPSPGLDATANYIAAEFRRFGLSPGGTDGSFLQRYPIKRRQIDLARSSVSVVGGPTWRGGDDVLPHLGGTPPEGITASAVLITGSRGDIDAVGDLAIENKVVVVAGPRSTIMSSDLLEPLMQRGPAGILLVTNSSDARWQRAIRNLQQSRWQRGSGPTTETPILEIRESTIAPILERHGHRLAGRPPGGPFIERALPSLKLTITIAATQVTASAPNVVGILEGSDPVLRNEYVVFSAHMDHVGVGRAVNGDSIYNGADDDASGTIAVVEAAEAFAMLDPRPKRSLIFLTVSGEEKGLWGSTFFTEEPPVPLSQMVANLNMDMVGRNWTDTIVVIGKEHSDLGETLERVSRQHPELDMTPIDDLWPQERFYFRSDHYSFAKHGVPILFFFNGTHDNYHRPSDHVDLIDAEKESRLVRLVFFLGLEVANATERPRWNQESFEKIVTGPR